MDGYVERWTQLLDLQEKSRLDLAKYTRYPVLVPSPTPAYNCHYESDFLIKYYQENNLSIDIKLH